MNIVEEAARLIDPGAFGPEWIRMSGHEDDSDALDRTRRAYMQSKALHIAAQILKLAVTSGDLRKQLITFERDGWEKLGIPRNMLDKPEVMAIIEGKFA